MSDKLDMSSTFWTGYRIDLENREALIENSTPMSDEVTYKGDEQSRRCQEWMRTENQGQVGRCGGMGNAEVGEVNNWIATQGEIIQFNGHFSYIKAQTFTPSLYGRDQGSTIDSNLKASMQFGYCPTGEGDGCPDKNWKYGLPPQYTTQLPKGAEELAGNFKIRSYTWLTSGDELHRYLKSGAGAVLVGARWGYWEPDAQGYVRRFRSGGGGHAWAIPDHQDQKDGGLPIMHNSHGKGWGLNGWAYLTDEFVDGLFRDTTYTSVVGMSDLTIPAPRKIDWTTVDGY